MHYCIITYIPESTVIDQIENPQPHMLTMKRKLFPALAY